MSVLQKATNCLRDIESELRASDRDSGPDMQHLADRVQRVVELLSYDHARWVGTIEAKRMLGVSSENTVKAWAGLGLLRSRTLPNGRLQFLVDDVLYRRAEREGLSALGGEEMTPEELRILHETTPGTYPWERYPPDPRS